jgi:carbon-monoxide dehydrogenase large subunit
MDRALALIDYRGFAERRARVAQEGRLRGIGIANVIEQAAGGAPEWAQVRFDPSGAVTLTMGTHSHGQGHETVFRQILASRLGIDPTRIRYEQGDSDAGMAGTGTFGSRSSGTGGASIVLAADKIIAKCRRIASHRLETAEDDLELADGVFRVAGTDRAIALVDCAIAAQDYSVAPPDVEVGMNEWAAWRPPAPTFPNGCHACEVEIDPETGAIALVRYVAVDDFGTVLNPLLADGQLHGGIAQGIGQVLMEAVVWDRASGQLQSGSFMDYPLPRADQLPSFELETNPIPTPINPLGVKGVGEVGCVGALPAVMNAIVDALRPLGVRALDMPATPARVWEAIHAAREPVSGARPR